MGPKQYLMRRRMHLVRRALLSAVTETTVTEIATRFGFWHLGRFSGCYQTIFGEFPSATLQIVCADQSGILKSSEQNGVLSITSRLIHPTTN